jgi:hypothetical protein
MARTAVIGVIVTLLAALVAIGGDALGITTVWPVLLAVAVGLAARQPTVGRIGAYVIGILAAWGAVALGAGLLPQTGLADAIALMVGLGILTVIAAVTGDHVPLWAGLAGYVAFTAFYEPIYAANPTLFLSESPVALLTVLLAGGIGFAIAGLAALFTAGAADTDELPSAPAMVAEGEVL